MIESVGNSIRITSSTNYSQLLTEAEWIEAARVFHIYNRNKGALEFCDRLADALDEWLDEIDFQFVNLSAQFRACDGDPSGEDWPSQVALTASGVTYREPIEVSAEDWGSVPTRQAIRLLLQELLAAKSRKATGELA